MAGGTAALTLRTEGFDGQVILVGDESLPPYERPPLSKGYLAGETPLEAAFLRPEEFYAENSITTCFGRRVASLDPEAKSARLEDGKTIAFNQVLITTGARNRRLPIPGLSLEGVFDLRTVADVECMRPQLVPGRRAVVLG